MKRYYVYILLCSDNTYYTGITNNIDRRLSEHETGCNPGSYTHNRRPVKLAFVQPFNQVIQAIAFEKRIKKWSKAKKEALMKGNWEALPALAKKKNFKKG